MDETTTKHEGISDLQAAEIRQAILDGITEVELARRYHVTRQYINQIRLNQVKKGFGPDASCETRLSRRAADIDRLLPALESGGYSRKELAHKTGLNYFRVAYLIEFLRHEKLFTGDVKKDPNNLYNPNRRVGAKKLSFAIAEEIRALKANGWTTKALEKKYGVSKSAIQKIVARRIWDRETFATPKQEFPVRRIIRLTDEQQDAIMAMWREGKPASQIAPLFGVSEGRIYFIRDQYQKKGLL